MIRQIDNSLYSKTVISVPDRTWDFPVVWAPYIPLLITNTDRQLEFDFADDMRPQREHQMSLGLDGDDSSLIIATLPRTNRCHYTTNPVDR